MATLANMKYSHDAMVDVIVANPSIKQKELAAMFGRSDAWISVVMASDVFQMKLAERRQEIIDPLMKEEIEARFKMVTRRSLEVLQEKLNSPSSVVDAGLALKAAELGMKGMGIGQPQPVAGQESGGDRISRLAQRLEGLLGPATSPTRAPLVDVVDVPVKRVD
jgi:hypothetical protein